VNVELDGNVAEGVMTVANNGRQTLQAAPPRAHVEIGGGRARSGQTIAGPVARTAGEQADRRNIGRESRLPLRRASPAASAGRIGDRHHAFGDVASSSTFTFVNAIERHDIGAGLSAKRPKPPLPGGACPTQTQRVAHDGLSTGDGASISGWCGWRRAIEGQFHRRGDQPASNPERSPTASPQVAG